MRSWPRGSGALLLLALSILPALAGCAAWIRYEDIGDGDLKGRLLVQWDREDRFIYRKQSDPLSFRPSFMNAEIVPEDMYTDGGSVPRIFWGVPGLSPWGLGPAYVIHDWIFLVHRCQRPAPPEVAQITFGQSALILAEIGKALVEAGLVRHNLLEAIVWGVRTRYARDLWDRPPTIEECRSPSPLPTVRKGALYRREPGLPTVADFTVPRKAR
jgi:hypothetical protein